MNVLNVSTGKKLRIENEELRIKEVKNKEEMRQRKGKEK
jgi:hypothetical protein